jgi:predicted Fe-Mo cluster-binding NifX family protein
VKYNKETTLLFVLPVFVLTVAMLLINYSSSFSFDSICANTQPQLLNTLMNQTTPIKPVAQVQIVTNSNVAFVTSGPSTSANMIGENPDSFYLVIANLKDQKYTVVQPTRTGELSDAVRGQNVQAVIANSISSKSVRALKANGIASYNGVYGHVNDVIALYQSGQLLAMQ